MVIAALGIQHVEAQLATTDSPTERAPQVAALLFDEGIAHAQGELLNAYLHLLNEFLRSGAASRADRLQIIKLVHTLTIRREAEQLAADPEARRNVTIAATRFARKAQSGFSATPLPEPSADHQSETKPA